MEIFQPIIDVFNFILSILSTIIDGIYGTILIITNIISFVLSISALLPEPLFSSFVVFLSLYTAIFTFKIFRQG